MDWSLVTSLDGVHDVIETPDIIYILTTKKVRLPLIVTDKLIKQLNIMGIYAAKELQEIIGAKSFVHGDLSKKNLLVRRTLIKMDLSGLSPSRKQQLAHSLYGTRKKEGALKKIRGEKAGRGSIIVPVDKTEYIYGIIAKYGAKATMKTIFMESEK